MPSMWFITPAYGRVELARICLTHLRHTCDKLGENGIDATAVVIADDENLHTARELGFATVERDNRFLSRKFNDGIQLALDRRHNPRPADYVVPFGSDDWVDYRILLDLPPGNTIRCFQRVSFVREDGLEMTSRFLNYPGGCGIRVYPRQVMAHRDFRPADEDRERACDTSILRNLQEAHRRLRILHVDIDARQIVDWKSVGTQLNRYDDLRQHKPVGRDDPFKQLAAVYPADMLERMAAHYGVPALAAA